MSFPDCYIVDTNVPKTANLSLDPNKIPHDLVDCVEACVNVIEQVRSNFNLVLDDGDEIFNEYRQQLSMGGQPGVGDAFMKWVHDHRYHLPEKNRVVITKNGDSYLEFPDHDDLTNFDLSDRKFIAVANAHPDKPEILQATDSKWWGWKDALMETGISVDFLCKDYISTKFEKKIGS